MTDTLSMDPDAGLHEHVEEDSLDIHAMLKDEANIEPDPVHTGEVTKETQVIAIYGKGGIGKSFSLANLSYNLARQGKKVLLIGCDPKADTTSLLFSGRSCPTIIETSAAKKAAVLKGRMLNDRLEISVGFFCCTKRCPSWKL